MSKEYSRDKKWDAYTNEELFTYYKETADILCKQEIAMRYVSLIRSIAVQMRNVYLGFDEVEDMVNEGVIVLMKAIDKYDPDMNVKFETYVSKRIRGMIIDIARKQDWVPRNLRKSYNDISEMSMQYYLVNGREPTAEEVAKQLDVTEEKYHEVMNKSNMLYILSLDMALEEKSEQRRGTQLPSKNESEQPEYRVIEEEIRDTLSEAIRSLKEQEQLVVSLYYVEELSMKDIASVLHVSEPRISQIHSKAIKKMRDYMKKEDEHVSRIL